MAMLIGIANEHEFYSQHFLDEELSEAIKDKVKAARDKEDNSRRESEEAKRKGIEVPCWRAPWSRLNGSAREILQSIHEAEALDGEKRIEAELEVISGLFGCLGLPFAPQSKPLECGLMLPLIAETETSKAEPYLWAFHATVLGGVEGEAGSAIENGTDPLELCIAKEQFSCIHTKYTGGGYWGK